MIRVVYQYFMVLREFYNWRMNLQQLVMYFIVGNNTYVDVWSPKSLVVETKSVTYFKWEFFFSLKFHHALGGCNSDTYFRYKFHILDYFSHWKFFLFVSYHLHIILIQKNYRKIFFFLTSKYYKYGLHCVNTNKFKHSFILRLSFWVFFIHLACSNCTKKRKATFNFQHNSDWLKVISALIGYIKSCWLLATFLYSRTYLFVNIVCIQSKP